MDYSQTCKPQSARDSRLGRLWAVVGLALIALLPACTTVTIAEATAIAQGGSFDAQSYVEARWPDISAAILEKSVDLPAVLSGISVNASGQAAKDNLQQVAQQYGLTTVGEAHVFMVKGQGMVTAVNTQSSAGTMEVAIDGYAGPIKVKFFVGPRIPSDETSVRDGVGFISFGDLKEQTEYGKVSRELNKRVVQNVFEGLDRENLAGKSVSFFGVFTIRTFNEPGDINVSEIVIVPTQLVVGG